MSTGITAINEEVQKASAFVRPLFSEIGKVVIGQNYLIERRRRRIRCISRSLTNWSASLNAK